MTPAFIPVVVLFWEANGLDLFDVYLLQALYAGAVVLFEVPTGMVADRLGKRTSLLLASAVMVVALGIYSLAFDFWGFLLAEVLLAVAAALYSGADSALLYDTLEALDRTGEYTRWAGRMRAAQLTSFAASNVAGGLIAVHSLRATVVVSIVGPVLAIGVALLLKEVADTGPRTSLHESWREYRTLLGDAVRFVSRHQLVRWHLLFFAVLSSTSMWLLWLYQPYFTYSGLPLWTFGLVFALYNGWAALASAWTHRLEASLGPRWSLVALVVLQVVPLGLMATFVGPWSFLFVLGPQSTRAFSRPMLSQRILATPGRTSAQRCCHSCRWAAVWSSR